MLLIFSCGNQSRPSLYPIEQNGKWGFIDSGGNVKIAPQFDFVSDPLSQTEPSFSGSEGLELVGIEGKFGFIDWTGKFGTNPRFTRAWSFSCGLAGVESDGKKGSLHQRGKVGVR